MGAGVYGGVLDFSIPPSPFTCYVTIETQSHQGYMLHYRVNHLSPCICTYDQPCQNSATVIGVFGSLSDDHYCFDNDTRPNAFQTRVAQKITLRVVTNSTQDLKFSMDFYTSRYGYCNNNEIQCDTCVHRNLACDASGLYCNVTGNQCKGSNTDSSFSSQDINKIAGYVVAGCLLVILIVTCSWWRKQNSKSFKFCPCLCGKTEEDTEASTRAREIFIAQLASRGVPSSSQLSGNENGSYTEEWQRINELLAQPPPEYSSLENLDETCKSPTKDIEELPPSYDDTVQNLDKYKVKEDAGSSS